MFTKDIKNYEKFPVLTEEQLNEQYNGIVKFLEAVYPFLKLPKLQRDGKGEDTAVEIRLLRRDRPNPCYKSINLWHWTDKELLRLKTFLRKRNEENIPYCAYFSIYGFDYAMEAKNASGKKAMKGTIVKENARFTQILLMDFDGMNEEEFLGYKSALMSLGIETIDVRSGHGFQSTILLDKPINDTNLMKKFVLLMEKKGFPVDKKLKDPCRVARVPFTFNSKGFSDKFPQYEEEAIPTFICSWTDNRYSTSEIFAKLDTLPDVGDAQIEIDLDENFNVIEVVKPEVKLDTTITVDKTTLEKTVEKFEEKQIEAVPVFEGKLDKYDTEELQKIYPMLDIKTLQAPICRILLGCQSGYAQMSVMFLVPYFKSLGFSRERITSILSVWAVQSTFNYPWTVGDVKSLIDQFWSYKVGTNNYNKTLAKKYGYLDFETIFSFKSDKFIIINNDVFNDFKKISSTAWRIYLVMRFEEHTQQKENFTIDEIIEYTQLSKRTVERNIKELVTLRYIDKHKRFDRKEKDTYFVNKFYSENKGFTKFSTNFIERFLLRLTTTDKRKQLNDSEVQLCCYIAHMLYHTDAMCCASQSYLADKMGLDRTSINRLVKSLDQKALIRKETENITEFVKFCKYTVLF